MKNTRVAWLLPTFWFYWQPSLSELSKLFSNTKVFAGLFPGYAKGFKDCVDTEVIGSRRIIALSKSEKSYGDNFTYLSLEIVPKLFQFKPDVIFSNSFGIWSILALLFKFVGRWKVVLAYEGSSPGVDYRNSALRLALRRAMVRFADACITNSHAGKEYLTEILNASEGKVFVQPYEVPDVRSLASINENLEFVSQNSDLKFSDLKRPVFLFVGGIVHRKGVRCLLEACRILKESGAGDFTMMLVGDGEQQAELQELSHTYQLEDHVVWVGRVEYDNISTYFHQADVFVFPTLEDTWGMVILEAMLLGKPILCSSGAGASELVMEGKNGYCFEPEKPDKLALVMQKIIEHPGSIQQMGEYSMQIMNQFTPRLAAEMMSKVVTQITTSN